MTAKQLVLFREVARTSTGYRIETKRSPVKTGALSRLGLERTVEQNRSDAYRIMECLQRDGFVERRTEHGGLWFMTAAAENEIRGNTPLARAMRVDVVSARLLRSIQPLKKAA